MLEMFAVLRRLLEAHEDTEGLREFVQEEYQPSRADDPDAAPDQPF